MLPYLFIYLFFSFNYKIIIFVSCVCSLILSNSICLNKWFVLSSKQATNQPSYLLRPLNPPRNPPPFLPSPFNLIKRLNLNKIERQIKPKHTPRMNGTLPYCAYYLLLLLLILLLFCSLIILNLAH